MLDVERERIHDAPPADRARTGALRDLSPRVEERDARAAHEPLQRATHEVVDPSCVNIERERADGLVRVDDEDRAPPMADLRERTNILDPSRREVDVASADRRGALVDRALEQLEWHAHAVGTANELDARTAVLDREERVTIRREVEIGDDDPGTLRVVEGARDPDETCGDVRLDRDLIRGRAEHRGEVFT
jgi:hypothetical protein